MDAGDDAGDEIAIIRGTTGFVWLVLYVNEILILALNDAICTLLRKMRAKPVAYPDNISEESEYGTSRINS